MLPADTINDMAIASYRTGATAGLLDASRSTVDTTPTPPVRGMIADDAQVVMPPTPI